jgi:hypothetical protein
VARALVPPPFGDAIAGRGLRVILPIEEKLDDGDWTAKTFASRWTYRVRAYAEDGALTSFVINDAVAAASDQTARPGWLDDYIPCGATAYDMLLWELVEVDGNGTDTATSTDKPEVVLLSWRQPILSAAITV